MLNENHLLIFFIIFLVIMIVSLIINRFFKNKIPVTSLKGFDSLNELSEHFKIAFNIIIKNKWLILFPVIIAVINFLQRVPVSLWMNYKYSHYNETFDINKIKINFSIYKFLNTLMLTPYHLNYAYSSILNGSFVFLILFFILLVFQQIYYKKLLEYVDGNNIDNFKFIKKIFKFASIFFLTGMLLFTITVILKFKILSIILAMASIILIIIPLLLLFSLLQGIIYCYIRNIFFKKESNLKILFNECLTVIKELFLLNLIIPLLIYISTFILLTISMADVVGKQDLFGTYSSLLTNTSNILKNLNSPILIFTVMAPIILVIKKENFINTFKDNFLFVYNFFLKYIFFIVSGLLIIFIPDILSILYSPFNKGFFNIFIFLDLGITFITIFLSALFYISLFNFYISTKNIKLPVKE